MREDYATVAFYTDTSLVDDPHTYFDFLRALKSLHLKFDPVG